MSDAERIVRNRIFQRFGLGMLEALDRDGKIPATEEQIEPAVGEYFETMFDNSIADWTWD